MVGFKCQRKTEAHEDRAGDAVDDGDALGVFKPAAGIVGAEDQQRKPNHAQQTVNSGEYEAHEEQ